VLFEVFCVSTKREGKKHSKPVGLECFF
jgi:hypothetical protein